MEAKKDFTWGDGLFLLLAVPMVVTFLVAVGYVFSVEGAPILHWIAFVIMITSPVTMSAALGLMVVDGSARLAGVPNVFASHAARATRVMKVIVVLGSFAGYYQFGGDILSLINTIDCDTYTMEARSERPRCR